MRPTDVLQFMLGTWRRAATCACASRGAGRGKGRVSCMHVDSMAAPGCRGRSRLG